MRDVPTDDKGIESGQRRGGRRFAKDSGFARQARLAFEDGAVSHGDSSAAGITDCRDHLVQARRP